MMRLGHPDSMPVWHFHLILSYHRPAHLGVAVTDLSSVDSRLRRGGPDHGGSGRTSALYQEWAYITIHLAYVTSG